MAVLEDFYAPTFRENERSLTPDGFQHWHESDHWELFEQLRLQVGAG